MLNDDEKALITERLRTEEQIRAQLRPPSPAPSKFAWLEHKIFLLFVGFILTGVLVPLLQYTQETITWKRQNRYDNQKYRLNMMRDGSTQFVQLWALTIQTYQQMQPFLKASDLSPIELQAFQNQSIELENKSADQSAKVASLLIHYPAREEIAHQFNEFLKRRTLFMVLVKQSVAAKRAQSANQPGNAGPAAAVTGDASDLAVERSMDELNEVYEATIDRMKQQIERIENENEKFM